jgi:hypothetical protein
VHFVNVSLKSQQMQQLFIQFINYVWYRLHVSACTSLDTTCPSTIFYRLLLNWASLRRH